MGYEQGDLVQCRAAFYDTQNSDALADPATVVFKVKPPSGSTTTYTYGTDSQLVKESTGRYRVDVNANAGGTWTYRFEATGTLQTAGERTFSVKATGT